MQVCELRVQGSSSAWRALPQAKLFMWSLAKRDPAALAEVWRTADKDRVVMIFALMLEALETDFDELAVFAALVDDVRPAGMSKVKAWQIALAAVNKNNK